MSLKNWFSNSKNFVLVYKKQIGLIAVGAALAIGSSFALQPKSWNKHDYAQMWFGCNFDLSHQGIPFGAGFKFCDCVLDKAEKKVTMQQMLSETSDEDLLAQIRNIGLSCQNLIEQ